jgi:lysozyme
VDVTEALAIVMRMCIMFEGIYLKPYLCPAGVPTIGVGCTHYLDGRAVRLTDPAISREHALILLRNRILTEFMPGVRALTRAADTPGKFAALTDMAFNVGLRNLKASTLLKVINAGRWDLAPAQFLRWNMAKGKVLRGLKRRCEYRVTLVSGNKPS